MQDSWKLSLRTAFKNFRRDRPEESDQGARCRPATAVEGPPSKQLRMFSSGDGSAQLEGEEYEEALTELKRAHRSDKKGRNYARIKFLMESTCQQRRKWIVEERPLVAEILHVSFSVFQQSSKFTSIVYC